MLGVIGVSKNNFFLSKFMGKCFLASLVVLAIAHQAISVVFFSTTVFEKIVFSLFSGLLFLNSVVFLIRRRSLSINRFIFLFFVGVISVTYIFVYFFYYDFFSYYILRDFVIGINFFSVLIISYDKILFPSRNTLKILTIIIFLIACMSPLFQNSVGRFREPLLILFPLVSYLCLSSRYVFKPAWAGVFFVLMVLAFFSGQRTSFLLSLVTLIFYFYGTRDKFVAIIVFSFIILPVAILFLDNIQQWLSDTRFEKIISGQVDYSILNRFYEMNDAIDSAKNMGCLYIGCGHGALFISQNVASGTNILNDYGYAHHIHITPSALFFRYGIVGLVLYSLALIRSVKIFFRESLHTADGAISLAFAFWIFNGLMFDVTTQPFFWVSFLFYRLFQGNIKYEQE